MKLLATDYDGTFKSNPRSLQLNKVAIENFMSKGNKFAIVTGRNFNSIKKEINRYGIKYDYLACNNGLILFDNKDKIISSSVLSSDDLNFICDSAKKFGIKTPRLYNYYSRTDNNENILEVFLCFKNINSAREYIKNIESNLDNIKCFYVGPYIFISNKINKADAVSLISKRENIILDNIFTVGDYKNDIEMLEKYNGHKMLLSKPNLWFKQIPITRQVHTLVKKIDDR